MIGRISSMLAGVAVGAFFGDEILRGLGLTAKARTASSAVSRRDPPPPLPAGVRNWKPMSEPRPDKPIALTTMMRTVALHGAHRDLLGDEPTPTSAEDDFKKLYKCYKRLLRQIGLVGAAVGRYGRASPPDDAWAQYYEKLYRWAARIIYDQLNEDVLTHPAVVGAVGSIVDISNQLNEVAKEFANATETVNDIDAALGFVTSLLGFFAPEQT